MKYKTVKLFVSFLNLKSSSINGKKRTFLVKYGWKIYEVFRDSNYLMSWNEFLALDQYLIKAALHQIYYKIYGNLET